MRERAESAKSADALRITTQFRVRDGMAYELREHGARLTVLITQARSASEWSCEAFTEPSSTVATAAPTRAEALRTTIDAWKADGAARGLPSFDWDAVTRALSSVHAI